MKKILIIVLLFLCVFLNAKSNYDLWKEKDTKNLMYLAYVKDIGGDLTLEKVKTSNWAIIQISEKNYDLIYFEKGVMYKLVSYEMSRDRSALRIVNFYKEIFDKFFEKEPFYSFLAVFNIFSDLSFKYNSFDELSVDRFWFPTNIDNYDKNYFVEVKLFELYREKLNKQLEEIRRKRDEEIEKNLNEAKKFWQW